MHSHQKSIGRSRATALFASQWWLNRTTREIVKFQLFTEELCLPFGIFHHALKEVLGRPIWIHEFGFGVEELIQEFLHERDAPTLTEILALLPPTQQQAYFLDE